MSALGYKYIHCIVITIVKIMNLIRIFFLLGRRQYIK